VDTLVKEVALNADPQVVGEHIEKSRQWRASAPRRLALPVRCPPLGQVARYHWEFDVRRSGQGDRQPRKSCWPPLFKNPPEMTRNDCINKRQKFSTRLAARLLLEILIDTALQFWGLSVGVFGFHSGIVILALEAALYTKALLFLDVGAAYAISSLSLISVTFMSQCLLRERVTKTRWIGVCLIFIGVGLVVGRT
jgi:multidrug transporter EmrE-like cation transporter